MFAPSRVQLYVFERRKKLIEVKDAKLPPANRVLVIRARIAAEA
jgi:hypothetical protein